MKSRIIALVLTVVLLIAGVAFLLTRGGGEEVAIDRPAPTEDERANMTPQERARAHLDTLPDGNHQGRLLTIDQQTVTFRMVQVLGGPAAVDAAREDGQLVGDSLPGGVYVRDTFQTLTLPLAADGAFRIQSCANGCQLVDTTLDALIAGEAVPHGGAANAFTFTVSGGEVVSLEEIALP